MVKLAWPTNKLRNAWGVLKVPLTSQDARCHQLKVYDERRNTGPLSAKVGVHSLRFGNPSLASQKDCGSSESVSFGELKAEDVISLIVIGGKPVSREKCLATSGKLNHFHCYHVFYVSSRLLLKIFRCRVW